MIITKLSTAISFVISMFLLTFPSVMLGAETNYPFGHGALEVFGSEGLAVTPMWVRVWLCIMMATFATGFYFAWKHPLARWAVGGFIISMTTSRFIFSALDLPFLGGGIALMHIICWSPALIQLLLKCPYFDSNESASFRVWAGLMTGVIIFSFIFDFRDAAIYLSHINALG